MSGSDHAVNQGWVVAGERAESDRLDMGGGVTVRWATREERAADPEADRVVEGPRGRVVLPRGLSVQLGPAVESVR